MRKPLGVVLPVSSLTLLWLLICVSGAEAWVLSGNPEVTSYLGMRSCRKRSVMIGGQKTAWLKYEVRSQQQQQQQQQQQRQRLPPQTVPPLQQQQQHRQRRQGQQ